MGFPPEKWFAAAALSACTTVLMTTPVLSSRTVPTGSTSAAKDYESALHTLKSPRLLADVSGREEIARDFLRSHPADVRGADLLSRVTWADPESVGLKGRIYREILASYPTHPDRARFERYLQRAAWMGRPFDLSFQCAVTGQQYGPDSFRGKVIAVLFSAPWCLPCHSVEAELKALGRSIGHANFQVVSVSADLDRLRCELSDVVGHARRSGLDWPQYHIDGDWHDIADRYGVVALPTVFLISRHGVVAEIDATLNLTEKVNALAAETPR